MIKEIDTWAINTVKKISHPLARVALFIIFFWFGILKLFGQSPANTLVEHLLNQTMPWIPFSVFIIILGSFEMIIGILFLIPRAERIAILIMVLHMFTTFLPLVILPHDVWKHFLVPTLEGQYIIKNLVIIALALGVAEHLEPIKDKISR